MDNKFSLIFENTPIEQVFYKLKDICSRYRNYKYEKTKWNIFCVKHEFPSYIVLTVVDSGFEIPRGNRHDTPLFHVRLEQVGIDTIVVCEFKWRKWKKYLSIITTIISFIIWGIWIHKTIVSFEYEILFMLVLWTVIPISIIFVWIVQNIKHDNLTKKLFMYLLKKESLKNDER